MSEQYQLLGPNTVERIKTMDISTLDLLKKELEKLVEQRKREIIESERPSKTVDELVAEYRSFGYPIKKGDRFYRITHGDLEGYYGLQVGTFRHECHIETTDFIVLFVLGSTENREIVRESDFNLGRPMVV